MKKREVFGFASRLVLFKQLGNIHPDPAANEFGNFLKQSGTQCDVILHVPSSGREKQLVSVQHKSSDEDPTVRREIPDEVKEQRTARSESGC